MDRKNIEITFKTNCIQRRSDARLIVVYPHSILYSNKKLYNKNWDPQEKERKQSFEIEGIPSISEKKLMVLRFLFRIVGKDSSAVQKFGLAMRMSFW